jgi:outer membrane autotransporter protein
MTSLSLASRYGFKIGPNSHNLRVTYGYSDRKDKFNPLAENERTRVSVGLATTFPKNLKIDIAYDWSSTDVKKQKRSTDIGKLNVRGHAVLLEGKIRISAGRSAVVSSGSEATFESTRLSFNVGCDYQVTRNLSTGIGYESVAFDDAAEGENNYREKVFRLHLTHRFALTP